MLHSSRKSTLPTTNQKLSRELNIRCGVGQLGAEGVDAAQQPAGRQLRKGGAEYRRQIGAAFGGACRRASPSKGSLAQQGAARSDQFKGLGEAGLGSAVWYPNATPRVLGRDQQAQRGSMIASAPAGVARNRMRRCVPPRVFPVEQARSSMRARKHQQASSCAAARCRATWR